LKLERKSENIKCPREEKFQHSHSSGSNLELPIMIDREAASERWPKRALLNVGNASRKGNGGLLKPRKGTVDKECSQRGVGCFEAVSEYAPGQKGKRSIGGKVVSLHTNLGS